MPGRAAAVIVVAVLALTAANVVHAVTTEHPGPVEVQPSNDPGELILAGGRGMAVRGGLFAHLAEVADGGVLVTPPSIWIEEAALRVIAGVDLIVDPDHDPTLTEEDAERLLRSPHTSGTYDAYIRPEAPWPYTVVHPREDGYDGTWWVFEYDDGVIIVPEPALSAGDGPGGDP